MKFLHPIIPVLSIILILASMAAAYKKAQCTGPSLCCIIEIIDEKCDEPRSPSDFSWTYQHNGNRHCISNITSLGGAMDAKCGPGIDYIKIYDDVDCLGQPREELCNPREVCFYPEDGWFIGSFVVGSSLLWPDVPKSTGKPT